jgi:hypothetical protein
VTTSLIARLAALCLTAFALLISGVHLLPERTPVMEDFDSLFLTSPACDEPCLLGVRPGMLLSEAIDLMRANGWITGLGSTNIFNPEVMVWWYWTGRQPDVINASAPGRLYARSNTDENGHYVIRLIVETHLPLYDLHRALGETASGSVMYQPQNDTLVYDVSYFDPESLLRTSIGIDLACPAHLISFFWRAPSRVTQAEGPPLFDYVPPEALPSLCRAEREIRR